MNKANELVDVALVLLEYSLDLINSSPPPTAVQTYLVGQNNSDVIHSATDLLGKPIKGHPEPRSSPTPLHHHPSLPPAHYLDLEKVFFPCSDYRSAATLPDQHDATTPPPPPKICQ